MEGLHEALADQLLQVADRLTQFRFRGLQVRNLGRQEVEPLLLRGQVFERVDVDRTEGVDLGAKPGDPLPELHDVDLRAPTDR